MTVANLYTLYAVNIGTTLVRGVTQQSAEGGVNLLAEILGGDVAPRHQSIAGRKPTSAFATQDLGALSACGPMGCSMATKPLTLYAQARQSGGTFQAAAGRSYKINHGILYPQSLSCDHQGNATLSYAALVTYDGVNAPIVTAGSVSMPSGAATVKLYTLGAVTLGGVAIPQVRRVQIDFGLTAESEGSGSDIEDTFPSIAQVKPKITVDTTDLAAGGLTLTGATGAISVQFRRRLDGGTFASDGHVTLTGSGMAWLAQPIQASGVASATAQILCEPKYDGVNDPLVLG